MSAPVDGQQQEHWRPSDQLSTQSGTRAGGSTDSAPVSATIPEHHGLPPLPTAHTAEGSPDFARGSSVGASASGPSGTKGDSEPVYREKQIKVLRSSLVFFPW